METVILDLQGNPGGSLDATVRIASEFLLGGDVVRTEGHDGSLAYPVRPDGEWKDDKRGLVVLVDRASASASEVLAAVLQERDRAVVIGENSFGKNTVQQQFPLGGRSVLRLTIGRWVTPEGQDFGISGVTPTSRSRSPSMPRKASSWTGHSPTSTPPLESVWRLMRRPAPRATVFGMGHSDDAAGVVLTALSEAIDTIASEPALDRVLSKLAEGARRLAQQGMPPSASPRPRGMPSTNSSPSG